MDLTAKLKQKSDFFIVGVSLIPIMPKFTAFYRIVAC